MTLIDAINEMIGWIGESPIDSTDPDYTDHPLYASALRILNTTSEAVQSRGWWFNTYKGTLTPVADAIALGASVLTVNVLNTSIDYTIRDGALFDLTNNTATIEDELTAMIRTLVTFDELPGTAATYITALASERFVKTYDGDRAKVADVKDDVEKAYIPFHADHIRNSKVNLYHTQSMGPILANSWYGRYRLR